MRVATLLRRRLAAALAPRMAIEAALGRYFASHLEEATERLLRGAPNDCATRTEAARLRDEPAATAVPCPGGDHAAAPGNGAPRPVAREVSESNSGEGAPGRTGPGAPLFPLLWGDLTAEERLEFLVYLRAEAESLEDASSGFGPGADSGSWARMNRGAIQALIDASPAEERLSLLDASTTRRPPAPMKLSVIR